ncbi:MAG: hypothetical protein HWN65_23300 [Candidatus Helarchaeota archaeon]|nr:hypothetical protein [Candidatus Helarchaeota archaeon]
MFLEGTFHVLWIYIIFGLVLCLPPLLLPQWKSLVEHFNKKEISSPKSFVLIMMGSGLIISVIAIILISLYNPYLFGPQSGELFFYFFSFTSFIILPFGLALIGSASYIHFSSKPKLGNFLLVLLALFAIGLGGSFLHDVIWCGTITNFYTQEWVTQSHDLDFWCNLLRVESKDYRVFGFYMLVMVIILLIFAAILLWRHRSFVEKKHSIDGRKKTLIFSTLVIIVLALSLYVIDYKRFFTFFWAFMFTYLGIPLTVILSYYLGKNLVSSSNSHGN